MAHPLLVHRYMDKREVVIGSPCTLDWRAMTPRDGGRFCGDCKKVVRDLSSMTEREAKALLRGPDTANLCVRYVYDTRGQIMFEQKLVSPALLSRARRAAAVVVTAALPLAVQACDIENDASSDTPNSDIAQRIYKPTEPDGEMMGGAPAMPDDPPVTPPDSADASTDDASTNDASSDDASTDTADGGVKIY